MSTELHEVQSIATGQFCADCGVYLGKPSGHPEMCRKCTDNLVSARVTTLKNRLVEIERAITSGEPTLASKAERDAIYAELDGYRGGES